MDYIFEKFKDLDECKSLILIDFDHTISDFTLMKQAIKRSCSLFGISPTLWDSTYDQAKDETNVYRTDHHIQILSHMTSVPQDKIKKAFYAEYENGKKYIFNDVISFLEKYKDENIVVFTLGTESFQMLKRKTSAIDKYMKGAIYSVGKKDVWLNVQLIDERDKIYIRALDKSFPKVIIVDDRPMSFKIYTNNLGNKLELIRLKRKGGRYEMEEDLPNTKIVNQLTDI